jgi:hypothetical protein
VFDFFNKMNMHAHVDEEEEESWRLARTSQLASEREDEPPGHRRVKRLTAEKRM